jgi:hypothetical protein
MSPQELGLACRALGGMGSSLDRDRLEERILEILSPPDPAPGESAPAPTAPLEVWLEGTRARISREAEEERREGRLRETMWLRAAVWAIAFALISWLGVFAYASDSLILAAGVGAVAAAIYGFRLALPGALGLAALELAARMALIGCGPAAPVGLVCLCAMELLCAAAMSVDAESARHSELTLGFREHVNAPSARTPEGGPPPEPTAETDATGSRAPR